MKCIFFLFKNAALHTAQQHRVSWRVMWDARSSEGKEFLKPLSTTALKILEHFPALKSLSERGMIFWEGGGEGQIHARNEA